MNPTGPHICTFRCHYHYLTPHAHKHTSICNPLPTHTSGGLLRESLEDLEWPQGTDVELVLGTQPNRLVLTSSGMSGKLQVRGNASSTKNL